MAITLLELRQLVYTLLNEASGSSVAELASSVSSTPTLTGDAVVNARINDACAYLCKSCVAIQDTGTYLLPSGTLSTPFTSLTTASGGTMWCAIAASWNGTSLQKTTQGYVNLNFHPLTDSAGTPQYFYQQGQFGVGVAPVPSTTQTLACWGCVIPAPLVADTDVASWCQDDETIYITYWAAQSIAKQNIEDTNLGMKIAPWQQEYEDARQRLFVRLVQVSPQIARAYFNVQPSGRMLPALDYQMQPQPDNPST